MITALRHKKTLCITKINYHYDLMNIFKFFKGKFSSYSLLEYSASRVNKMLCKNGNVYRIAAHKFCFT